MKSLKRSLLFAGLCLVPVLLLAAPAGSAEPAAALPGPAPGTSLAVGGDAAPGSWLVCSEAAAAMTGSEARVPLDFKTESELFTDEAAPASMERKPCKACSNQPWCECTYQGHPRVSCDPCCYATYTGEICLS